MTAPGAQRQAHGRLPTFYGYPCSWTQDARGFPSYIVTDDGEIADKRTSNDDVWYSTKAGDEFGPHLAKVRAGETLPEEAQWTPPAAPERQPRENQAPTTAPDPTPPPQPTPASDPEPVPAAHTNGNSPRPTERPGDAQKRAEEQARSAAAEPQAAALDPNNPFSTVDVATLRRLHALGRAVHNDDWREIGPERVTAHSDGRAERSDQLSHDEAIRLINELQAIIQERRQARERSPEYAG